MSAVPLLSRRYLCGGGVRSLLTCIAVLLASALVFGSGVILESVRAHMVKSAEETHGSYHLAYPGLEPSEAALLGAQVEVESWGYSYREEFVLPEAELTLDLTRLGGSAAELLGLEGRITEGEFPSRREELLIGERTSPLLGRSGARVDEYRIAGIITEPLYRSFLPAQPAWGRADSLTDLAGKEGQELILYLRLISPADIPRFTSTIAERSGLALPPVVRNEPLLNLYGYGSNADLSAAMRRFTLLIAAVILIAAATVVYNSFSVSLVERIREFGMLQAVGASPGQIRTLVIREAFLIGVVAIPAGIAAGFLGIRLLFYAADRISDNVIFENLQVRVSLPMIILSAATVAGALFLSALLPALRAGGLSPMDGVRTGRSTPLNERELHTLSRFPLRSGRGRWLAPFLAIRGIRRHGLRSAGTLISLAVPVILFVAFGGMLRLSREANLVQETRLPGLVYTRAGGVPRELSDLLWRHPDCAALYPVCRVDARFTLSATALSPAYRAYAEESHGRVAENGTVVIPEGRILSYGDEFFRESKLENGVWLVAESEFIDRKGVKRYLNPTLLEPGDEILVGSKTRPLTITGLLSSPPFQDYNPSPGGIDLVVSEEIYRSLSGDEGRPETLMILPLPGGRERIIELLERVRVVEGGELIDAQEVVDGMHKDYLALALFFYGFIGMILIIGGLNIVSSVHANLLLRRREFGLLAAAGMEPARVRTLILWEVLLLAGGAVLAGSAAGCALWSGLWYILGTVRGSEFFLPLTQLMIALTAVPALVLLAVHGEANRVSRRSVADQLRG